VAILAQETRLGPIDLQSGPGDGAAAAGRPGNRPRRRGAGPGGLPAAPGEITDTDPLRRPPAGTVTALRTVQFDYDSDALTAESQTILDGNADWLKANPTLQISIEGIATSAARLNIT